MFRRSVQRGFEALLDGMFLRGAFAGRTARDAFQVVVDSTLNTPASVDQGRFMTAGGVTAGIDLGLHLVSRWFGANLSNQVADVMEYPPDRQFLSIAACSIQMHAIPVVFLER